jgi:hypothetical protein
MGGLGRGCGWFWLDEVEQRYFGGWGGGEGKGISMLGLGLKQIKKEFVKNLFGHINK